MENRANLVVAFVRYLKENHKDCVLKENRNLFCSWPLAYQQVAEKIAELKLENEQLRMMCADLDQRYNEETTP